MAKYRFLSRYDTLIVPIKPGTKVVVNGEIVKTPGVKARFEKREFSTDDDMIGKALQQIAARQHDCGFTEDTRPLPPKKALKNIRTAATALDASKAAAEEKINRRVEEELMPKKVACPVCAKEFDTQKQVNMHLLSHRKGVTIDKETVENAVQLDEKDQQTTVQLIEGATEESS